MVAGIYLNAWSSTNRLHQKCIVFCTTVPLNVWQILLLFSGAALRRLFHCVSRHAVMALHFAECSQRFGGEGIALHCIALCKHWAVWRWGWRGGVTQGEEGAYHA